MVTLTTLSNPIRKPSLLSEKRGLVRSVLDKESKIDMQLEPSPFIFHNLASCKTEIMLCSAVVASEKGVVVGRLTFTEDGDPIDCARMGVGGKAIPPNVDKAIFFTEAN